jgi:hypothetical protein
MTPLDLEHRLSAIETAIAILASQEKPLMDLVIDVLEGEREQVMAVDDERYAFALLAELMKHRDGMNEYLSTKAD